MSNAVDHKYEPKQWLPGTKARALKELQNIFKHRGESDGKQAMGPTTPAELKEFQDHFDNLDPNDQAQYLRRLEDELMALMEDYGYQNSGDMPNFANLSDEGKREYLDQLAKKCMQAKEEKSNEFDEVVKQNNYDKPDNSSFVKRYKELNKQDRIKASQRRVDDLRLANGIVTAPFVVLAEMIHQMSGGRWTNTTLALIAIEQALDWLFKSPINKEIETQIELGDMQLAKDIAKTPSSMRESLMQEPVDKTPGQINARNNEAEQIMMGGLDEYEGPSVNC